MGAWAVAVELRSRRAGDPARSSELTLQELEIDLARTRIRAPFTGIVVYFSQNAEGEYIAPYTSLIQLAEPTELILSYSGAHLDDFRLGMEVEVHIDEEIYMGEVVLTPENLPENVPDSMRHKVYVKAFDLPAEISKGHHAFIHLILEKAEGVIIIPQHLVKTYKGITFVYVMDEGLRKQKNIKVGVQTSDEAEVIEGLTEEDALISR